MKSRRLLLLLFLTGAVLTTGCVRVDVGDEMPTIGEELVELQQAKHLGAITDEEFKRLRKAVLARL